MILNGDRLMLSNWWMSTLATLLQHLTRSPTQQIKEKQRNRQTHKQNPNPDWKITGTICRQDDYLCRISQRIYKNILRTSEFSNIVGYKENALKNCTFLQKKQ